MPSGLLLGGAGTNQNDLAVTVSGKARRSTHQERHLRRRHTIKTGASLSLTGALTNSSVTVNSGGALSGSGNGAFTGLIGGSLAVGGGGKFNLEAANSATPLPVTGGLTLGTENDLHPELHLGDSLEELIAGGALTLNSGGATVNILGSVLNTGTYDLLGFGSQTGSAVRLQYGTNTQSVSNGGRRTRSTTTPTCWSSSSPVRPSPSSPTSTATPTTAWNDLSGTKTNFSTDSRGRTTPTTPPAR